MFLVSVTSSKVSGQHLTWPRVLPVGLSTWSYAENGALGQNFCYSCIIIFFTENVVINDVVALNATIVVALVSPDQAVEEGILILSFLDEDFAPFCTRNENSIY